VAQISFPTIQVRGGPSERGQKYGQQASRRIRRSIEVYREAFLHIAGWSWRQTKEHAQTYVPAIERYRPHFLDEMAGIAAGAGLPFEDILALNVRTEVMFAAVARAAAKECTSFAALPEATKDGHTLLGQNWDWLTGTAETVIVLEAEPAEGPNFVTVVEAGLLAKIGMNERGIGLATNALVSDQDAGKAAVPYHTILRAILESETPSAALDAITRHPRASSANYLIAHRDGEAINVEAAPGDYSRIYMDFPAGGVYGHANHFICPGFDMKDVGIWDGPSSPFRARRMQRLLEQRRGDLDVAMLQTFLADHFNYPAAICYHPNTDLHPAEQYASVAAVVMDLDEATLWLADGNPCQTPFQRREYNTFLNQGQP